MTESAEKQAHKDREARKAFTAWFASQSPQEKKQLKELGLDHFDPEYKIQGASQKVAADCADEEDFSYLDEIRAEMDSLKNTATATAASTDELCATLAIFVAEWRSAANPRLYGDCFSFATGIIDDGETQSSIADRYRVTRQDVCKLVKAIQWTFRLKPRATQRSTAIAHANAQRAKQVHLRQQSTFC